MTANQPNTSRDSQQALQQAFEAPMEQSLQMQKSAAEMFMNSMEMGYWAQNQGIDLTRNLFQNYIDTVEDAVRSTERIAEQGIEMQQATMQQPQGFQQQGQFQQQPQQGQQYQQPQNQQFQQPRQPQGFQQPQGQQFQQPQQSQQPQGQRYQQPQNQQFQQPQGRQQRFQGSRPPRQQYGQQSTQRTRDAQGYETQESPAGEGPLEEPVPETDTLAGDQ